MCAPKAFAEHEKNQKPRMSWSELRPRLWGVLGLVLCGLAAYTVLEQGAPKFYLVLIALLSLAAVFKVMPSKS